MVVNLKERGRDIKVDSEIEEFLEYVNNELGLITTSSCSGVSTDHPSDDYDPFVVFDCDMRELDDAIEEAGWTVSKTRRPMRFRGQTRAKCPRQTYVELVRKPEDIRAEWPPSLPDDEVRRGWQRLRNQLGETFEREHVTRCRCR